MGFFIFILSIAFAILIFAARSPERRSNATTFGDICLFLAIVFLGQLFPFIMGIIVIAIYTRLLIAGKEW